MSGRVKWACRYIGRRRKARLKRLWRLVGVSMVLGIGSSVAVIWGSGAIFGDGSVFMGQGTWVRKLSSGDGSCGDAEDLHGGVGTVLLLTVGIIFTFNGLAIVCDEFFQASLEKISDELKLTPDVAGATFLAAGSSAPELFTSLNDAFGPINSIGMGTIVGSAMFNILVIVALSAAVATRRGTSLSIDWRVVARDVTFYTASIFLLGIMFLDEKIFWWEGLILMMGYVAYVVFMRFNQELLARCATPRVRPEDVDAGKQPLQPEKQAGDTQPAGNGSGSNGTEHKYPPPLPLKEDMLMAMSENNLGRGEGDLGRGTAPQARKLSMRDQRRVSRALRKSIWMERKTLDKDEGNSEEAIANGRMGTIKDFEEEDHFKFPEDTVGRTQFLFSLPFLVGLSLTVPDCSQPKNEKYFLVTFLASTVWIGVITHYMVVFATEVGCILGISPAVMGVLVLAVGTSVPDAIGSMIAAKNGEAAMAIANAVGSNVFDILLGLGFPWFLRALVYGEPTQVNVGGMKIALIILLCTVIAFVGILMASGWTMNRLVGYGLLSCYGVYVAYTIAVEAFTSSQR